MQKSSKAFIFTLLILFSVFAFSTVHAYTLQTEIPGSSPTDLPHYIQALYNYALSVVGILATVVIMFGGLLWVMAGGNASKIDNAKSWITAGITGFVLLMMSYTLLYMINPNLTTFRKLNPKLPDAVKTVSPVGNDVMGCCITDDSPDNPLCADLTYNTCVNDYKGQWQDRKTCYLGACVESGCCIFYVGGYSSSCLDKGISQLKCTNEYNGSFFGKQKCDFTIPQAPECKSGGAGNKW